MVITFRYEALLLGSHGSRITRLFIYSDRHGWCLRCAVQILEGLRTVELIVAELLLKLLPHVNVLILDGLFRNELLLLMSWWFEGRS